MRIRSFCWRAVFALRCAPAGVAQPVPDVRLNGLSWCLLGPFRGGWGTMAARIADQRDTFYCGAADGVVWKTDDAGTTWRPMSDGLDAASIGAIAIAPSRPNVLYAGSGQPEPRYDIAAGDGLYKSVDAGAHWQHAGLFSTRRCSYRSAASATGIRACETTVAAGPLQQIAGVAPVGALQARPASQRAASSRGYARSNK